MALRPEITRPVSRGAGDRTGFQPCPFQCSIRLRHDEPALDQPTAQQSLADTHVVPVICDQRLVRGAGVAATVHPPEPADGALGEGLSVTAAPDHDAGPQLARAQLGDTGEGAFPQTEDRADRPGRPQSPGLRPGMPVSPWLGRETGHGQPPRESAETAF